MARPIEVVRKVAKNAQTSYLAAIENGDALFQQHGITTPQRLAHFLAQILHESGGLKIEWENMNYSAERLVEIFGPGRHSAAIGPAEAVGLARHPEAIAERVYGRGNPAFADKLGNVNVGDGFKYRGGGLMQTTGRTNYRRMGQKCGVDFEGDPKLVLSADHALKPALTEWTEGNLNAFADSDDILAISRFINLGNARSPRTPNGMQSRLTWFATVQREIGQVDFAPGVPRPAPARTEDSPAPPAPQGQGAPAISLVALLGGKLLQQGDRSDTVRAMQLALAKLGYGLKGTGFFGGVTDTAVTDFQEQHDLEVDGVVGPETAKAIDAAIAALGGAAAPAGGAQQPGGQSTGNPGAPVPQGSGDRPMWLIEGLKWVGLKETQGASNNANILDWARAEGGDISKFYKDDSIPWCALYANMVLTKVGIKGTETLWALDWDKWGTKLGGPAVGAFAPMKRDGGGHIVIVVGKDQHGNLMCLGGNQSDQVSIIPFPANRPLSFRWPNEVPPPAKFGMATLPLVQSDGKVSTKES